MRIPPKTKELLIHFKTVITTPMGWLSWLLANVIWSLPWGVPLIFGLLTSNNDYIALASVIYLFFLQPLIPMWLVIPLTTFFIYKRIK